MNSLRTFIKISLITLALIGVQVIQASPLHDHSNHVVDCGLCHFSSTEIAIEDSPVVTPSTTPRYFSVPRTINITAKSIRLSYQGRAPPLPNH